jgi:hypothetical protein
VTLTVTQVFFDVRYVNNGYELEALKTVELFFCGVLRMKNPQNTTCEIVPASARGRANHG